MSRPLTSRAETGRSESRRRGTIDVMTSSRIRRWGEARAQLDDDVARNLLLDAAERCVIRCGGTQIRMTEVADEAGVARSTAYRYYPNRDEVLLALVLRRIERAHGRWLGALRRPTDAAASIRQLVLNPVAAVDDGDPVNLALYAGDSSALAPVLEHGAEAIAAVLAEQLGPLFAQWKTDGQIHADLDLVETVQWMSATTSFLLTAQWRHRPLSAKRRFVDRYLVRALVVDSH
ncbi:TetR family transcriptional regulator [Mycolicibacterium vaccae ATCC 25954]|uniref:TetR family transcriptional regulator n=2 Tax=Mycolicibacterium vaccae TaxID=1810 RepID=K0VFU8_MYCVA|nr:TetR family transcriptional regulator [Mycolicibacterium vaccae 95051]EJZ09964.1 TetR family transcriptional regulator [Mycolicibacterium vaccae ATCC 25954]